MRRYETIFILRPSLGEAEITAIIDNTCKIITDLQGTIIDLNRWGMRKFAYLIKKEAQGFYVYCEYAGLPEAVAEMERKFRIDDSVLKYMTVKLADAIDEDGIKQAIADAANKQVPSDDESTDDDYTEEADDDDDAASEDEEA